MGSNNSKCIKKSNSNPTINNIIVGPEFSDLENQLYDTQEQNKANINDYNEDNVSSLHTYNSNNASEEASISPKKIVNNELTSIDNIADQLNNIERTIVEEHLQACLTAKINISGLNAEVAPNQWEFQIGPCEGIESGDHMIIARFLLERIAEKYDVVINYTPKLYKHINGSGCHTNFSTSVTRHENGIEEIYKCMSKLEKKHAEHIAVYGKDNENRLTGIHETSSIHKFSFGVGTRNTSVRIPNQVVKDGCGYFEDRRPAANIDPYQVTSLVFQTCCLDEF
jgi:glutamine synthetase